MILSSLFGWYGLTEAFVGLTFEHVVVIIMLPLYPGEQRGTDVQGNEQRAPFFVLLNVNVFVQAKASEAVLIEADNDVSERHGFAFADAPKKPFGKTAGSLDGARDRTH